MNMMKANFQALQGREGIGMIFIQADHILQKNRQHLQTQPGPTN